MSFRKLIASIGVFMFAGFLVAAQACGDDLEKIHRFLDEHVVNTKLTVHSQGTVLDGKMAFDFQRDRVVCNLSQDGDRLSFDEVYIIKHKIWDLVDGEKSGDARIQDRILVNRFEFGKRASSGQVIGHCRQLTSTSTIWAGGAADSARVWLDDGVLVMERRTMGHVDLFDQGGDFFPGMMENETQWTVSDGKLTARQTKGISWRVDPESGELSERSESAVPDPDREVYRLPRQ